MHTYICTLYIYIYETKNERKNQGINKYINESKIWYL